MERNKSHPRPPTRRKSVLHTPKCRDSRLKKATASAERNRKIEEKLMGNIEANMSLSVKNFPLDEVEAASGGSY